MDPIVAVTMAVATAMLVTLPAFLVRLRNAETTPYRSKGTALRMELVLAE